MTRFVLFYWVVETDEVRPVPLFVFRTLVEARKCLKRMKLYSTKATRLQKVVRADI